MSLPERFSRIVRHKFHEIKDRISDMDAEAEEYDLKQLQTAQDRRHSRQDAVRELDDLHGEPRKPASSTIAPDLGNIQPRMRTPEEIRRGTPAGSGSPTPQAAVENDPLLPHYRLLGVEVGSDFQTVQAAYQRLYTRCEPSRFPEGSQEANDAEAIRTRLEETFRALKEVLDPVSRRFDILELDEPPSH